MAMKPDWRPMRRTRPTPFEALLASTLAASSACCASSTAVSNPKHLSICTAQHSSSASRWPSGGFRPLLAASGRFREGDLRHFQISFHNSRISDCWLPLSCRFGRCLNLKKSISQLPILFVSMQVHSVHHDMGSAQECGATQGHQEDVVVDGFGHSYNRAEHILDLALLLDRIRRSIAAIPSNCTPQIPQTPDTSRNQLQGGSREEHVETVVLREGSPTKSMLTPHRDSLRTISLMSAPPLEVPCSAIPHPTQITPSGNLSLHVSCKSREQYSACFQTKFCSRNVSGWAGYQGSRGWCRL